MLASRETRGAKAELATEEARELLLEEQLEAVLAGRLLVLPLSRSRAMAWSRAAPHSTSDSS